MIMLFRYTVIPRFLQEPWESHKKEMFVAVTSNDIFDKGIATGVALAMTPFQKRD